MKGRRTMTTLALTLSGTLAALAIGAVARDANATAPRARTAVPGYPSSIAVIGHSGATGSGVAGPRSNWVHSSWVTGDSPAVQSLYSRILARNPAVRGNKFMLAISGADVASDAAAGEEGSGAEADAGARRRPGHRQRHRLRQRQSQAVPGGVCPRARSLAAGLPDARIFVVSQFGSPGTWARALTLKQRIRVGGGSGPCDFIGRNGEIRPKRLAYLEAVIHRYEAAVATACKAVASCRYDGGAFGRVVDRREWISTDLFHFSLEGNAKAAAVAWAAL